MIETFQLRLDWLRVIVVCIDECKPIAIDYTSNITYYHPSYVNCNSRCRVRLRKEESRFIIAQTRSNHIMLKIHAVRS